MTRWIVAVLLCACVAVALGADKEPSDATCATLAATVKAEGKKRFDGPAHTFCGSTLEDKREAYCNCDVVPRKRELDLSEFLTPLKANSYLSGRKVAKRSLSEECCNEGCYWEEIEEVC